MRADLVADGSAARLRGFHHLAPCLPEAAREAPHLRGLARTVHAFKGDENAAFGHPKPIFSYIRFPRSLRYITHSGTGVPAVLRNFAISWPSDTAKTNPVTVVTKLQIKLS